MLKALSTDRWNYELAAHLLNRAGFGGSPDEIKQLADLSHDQAVASLLDYENIPDSTPDPVWAKPDPDHVKQLRDSIKAAYAGRAQDDPAAGIQNSIRAHDRVARLVAGTAWPKVRDRFRKRWFCSGMGISRRVSRKCANAYYMWRQNELFRRMATGNWQQLLTEAGKDPAMLYGWIRRKAARSIRTKISRAKTWSFFRSAKALHRKGRHRGRARADRLVFGPHQSKIYLPAVLSRQRRENFSWPHGQSQRRRRDGANRRATAGRTVHHGETMELFCGTTAV